MAEILTEILESDFFADMVSIFKLSYAVAFAFFILTTIISVVIIVKLIREWK